MAVAAGIGYSVVVVVAGRTDFLVFAVLCMCQYPEYVFAVTPPIAFFFVPRAVISDDEYVFFHTVFGHLFVDAPHEVCVVPVSRPDMTEYYVPG